MIKYVKIEKVHRCDEACLKEADSLKERMISEKR